MASIGFTNPYDNNKTRTQTLCITDNSVTEIDLVQGQNIITQAMEVKESERRFAVTVTICRTQI